VEIAALLDADALTGRVRGCYSRARWSPA